MGSKLTLLLSLICLAPAARSTQDINDLLISIDGPSVLKSLHFANSRSEGRMTFTYSIDTRLDTVRQQLGRFHVEGDPPRFRAAFPPHNRRVEVQDRSKGGKSTVSLELRDSKPFPLRSLDALPRVTAGGSLVNIGLAHHSGQFGFELRLNRPTREVARQLLRAGWGEWRPHRDTLRFYNDAGQWAVRAGLTAVDAHHCDLSFSLIPVEELPPGDFYPRTWSRRR